MPKKIADKAQSGPQKLQQQFDELMQITQQIEQKMAELGFNEKISKYIKNRYCVKKLASSPEGVHKSYVESSKFYNGLIRLNLTEKRVRELNTRATGIRATGAHILRVCCENLDLLRSCFNENQIFALTKPYRGDVIVVKAAQLVRKLNDKLKLPPKKLVRVIKLIVRLGKGRRGVINLNELDRRLDTLDEGKLTTDNTVSVLQDIVLKIELEQSQRDSLYAQRRRNKLQTQEEPELEQYFADSSTLVPDVSLSDEIESAKQSKGDPTASHDGDRATESSKLEAFTGRQEVDKVKLLSRETLKEPELPIIEPVELGRQLHLTIVDKMVTESPELKDFVKRYEIDNVTLLSRETLKELLKRLKRPKRLKRLKRPKRPKRLEPKRQPLSYDTEPVELDRRKQTIVDKNDDPVEKDAGRKDHHITLLKNPQSTEADSVAAQPTQDVAQNMMPAARPTGSTKFFPKPQKRTLPVAHNASSPAQEEEIIRKKTKRRYRLAPY